MSQPQLLQAVMDIMQNRGDNLSDRQKGLFVDIRQALALQEYLRNMEAAYKGANAPSLENPGTIRNGGDSGK
jgi:hypothetical protein